MATIQELHDQKMALERQILELQRKARAEAIEKITELMLEAGLTRADLPGSPVAVKSGNTGRKVQPKFRSPDGSEWSGRGLKPNWLKSQLATGKKLEDFAI